MSKLVNNLASALAKREFGEHYEGYESSHKELAEFCVVNLTPDWYWDNRCPEDGACDCVQDCIDYDDVGDEVVLRPVVELPEIRVRVTETGHEVLSEG
jgi:hypothetical protein